MDVLKEIGKTFLGIVVCAVMFFAYLVNENLCFSMAVGLVCVFAIGVTKSVFNYPVWIKKMMRNLGF